MSKSRPSICRADLLDLDQIEAICCACYPWRDDWRTVVQQTLCTPGKGGLVYRWGGDPAVVIGYAFVRLHRRHVELTDIGVSPEWRFQRVGTELVQALIEMASENQDVCIRADVGERNTVAQLFLRRLGFRATVTLGRHSKVDYRFVYRLKHQPKESA